MTFLARKVLKILRFAFFFGHPVFLSNEGEYYYYVADWHSISFHISQIKFGGKVPETYYLKNEFLHDGHLTEIYIGHGSKVELPYEVTEPGHVLK